jgi:hypothetical protein
MHAFDVILVMWGVVRITQTIDLIMQLIYVYALCTQVMVAALPESFVVATNLKRRLLNYTHSIKISSVNGRVIDAFQCDCAHHVYEEMLQG